MTHAPILMNPITGPDAEFVVTADASKYAVGAVLMQKDPNAGRLRSVAYLAKVLRGAQLQYSTYHTEFLGVVIALQHWQHYSEGCKHFTVIIDHITLRHLPTQEKLSRKHAGWFQIISPYKDNMNIVYRKRSHKYGRCTEQATRSKRSEGIIRCILYTYL